MKRTWKEIITKYPNEHVIIVDPLYLPDDLTKVTEGDVVDHDSVLDNLLNRCNLSLYNSYELKYTGDLGEAIGQRGMIRVVEHD